jgi:hypothetical protein
MSQLLFVSGGLPWPPKLNQICGTGASAPTTAWEAASVKVAAQIKRGFFIEALFHGDSELSQLRDLAMRHSTTDAHALLEQSYSNCSGSGREPHMPTSSGNVRFQG